MKKLLLISIVLAPCFSILFGQEINYGSNSGKHLAISDTEIYYEEYDSGSPLLLLHGGFGYSDKGLNIVKSNT